MTPRQRVDWTVRIIGGIILALIVAYALIDFRWNQRTAHLPDPTTNPVTIREDQKVIREWNASAGQKARDEADVPFRNRAACGEVYDQTINKKLTELTVKDSEQIKSCQSLGLYHQR